MFRTMTLALALTAVIAGPATAKGCIKGAIAGGVAGHYAGHHAVVGAVGGCFVGRHLAKKHDQSVAARQTSTTTMAVPARR